MTPMEKELVVKLLEVAIDAKLIAYMSRMSPGVKQEEVTKYNGKCKENLTEAVNILARG